MCGIIGIWNRKNQPVNLISLQKATTSLRHRGPDDEGYLLFNPLQNGLIPCGGNDSNHKLNLPQLEKFSGRPHSLAFGFRRLAILDLSPSGHQPMSSDNEKYWIILNGEIYNFVELRNELENLGHHFTSTSDTEVLLKGYIQWGKDVLSKLIGMFAFAILDIPERKLFIARDFFGIKPLYYSLDQNCFSFASEAKALLELGTVGRNVNPEALYLYLRHGLTDHDETSLWRDIKKLPPAHYMEIYLDTSERVNIQRYWEIRTDQNLIISEQDAAARLRSLFLESIRLHLRSDVPVGAALSGGIDSSAIVFAINQILDGKPDLHTFSYLADDPVYNEEKWIDLVGQGSNVQVHKTIFSADDLLEDIDHLIYSLDEPFGSTSIYAQYRVFRLARQKGIKVMLDGQGADELLGGYAPYLSGRIVSMLSNFEWNNIFPFLRKVWHRPDAESGKFLLRAAALLSPESLRNFGYRLVGPKQIPPWMNAYWFHEQGIAGHSIFVLNESDNKRALRSQLYQSFTTTSLPMLLRYEDHNSMVHSIESRVPFLTPEIINFIFSLPERFIIDDNGVSKSVFRQAMRGLVPDPILDRSDKIGFTTPERHLITILQSWVENTFDMFSASEVPVLNFQQIKTDYQQMITGTKSFDYKIWRWINFIHWVKLFKVDF